MVWRRWASIRAYCQLSCLQLIAIQQVANLSQPIIYPECSYRIQLGVNMTVTDLLPAMGLLLVFALVALGLLIRYGKKKT
jgi:hypothetical protein